ncbi:MAG: nucleotide sugar dehydrogenase [Proteobacteria bacterium]|nr:nucleotide sugar dehydrogenase [Pseudomonadota bacterium]
MRVSVFGLGYVGAVSASCLSSDGHQVIGVDNNQTKVDLINAGRPPIIETGVEALIQKGVAGKTLRATTSAAEAVQNSDLSIVCVGTPSESNGSLNLRHVRNVCADIGAALHDLDRYHAVVIRSTVLPGTMREVVIPALEAASGKKAGREFGICFNPEFLREGTAIKDYYQPPKTVVGESDARAGDQLLALYAGLDAPVIRTSLETAEMVKYVDNTWHALKVGFANEVGSICKPLGIDSVEVMQIFCQDTKLNISPYYLRPGFAFGGSCLPKDVRALRYKAKTLDVEVPILESILPSNNAHVQRAIDMVLAHGKKRVGVLGFSFKAGTDDLRESPIVELIERLIGKGYALELYDQNVNLAKLTGANRDYILNHIPHIASLMRDRIEQVLQHAEIVVIGNSAAEFSQIVGKLRPDQQVLDLVRLGAGTETHAQFEGICW